MQQYCIKYIILYYSIDDMTLPLHAPTRQTFVIYHITFFQLQTIVAILQDETKE